MVTRAARDEMLSPADTKEFGMAHVQDGGEPGPRRREEGRAGLDLPIGLGTVFGNDMGSLTTPRPAAALNPVPSPAKLKTV